jgi:methylase of polypeptide subunit release factors
MQNIAKLSSALTWAQAQGLERIDAQWLLLHVLGQPDAGRAWLIAHGGDADRPLYEHFSALCASAALRASRWPTSRAQGLLRPLELQVDARVLDPRPDTETLVDWALERLAGHPAPRVLDLGTGSGAIALALAHARPDATVLAVDASADALAVARANAERLRLPVQFAQSDWFSAVPGALLTSSSPTRPTLPNATRTCPRCGTNPWPLWWRAPTACAICAPSPRQRRPTCARRLAAAGARLGPGRGRANALAYPRL